MKKLRHNAVLATAVTTLTLSLAGCGSGNDPVANNVNNGNGKEAPPPIKAGEIFKASMLVEDVPVNETSYRYYSVSDSHGTLTDQPLPDVAQESVLPKVLVKDSTEIKAKINKEGVAVALATPIKLSAPVSIKTVEKCYANFWNEIKLKTSSLTNQQVAERITRFDLPVDTLCTYSAASGLTLTEYLNLYDAVSKYFPDRKNIQGDITMFFKDMKTTPKQFLTALSGVGADWDAFLKRLAATPGDVYKVDDDYRHSKLSLEPFLRNYMNRTNTAESKTGNEMKLLTAYLAKGMTPYYLALLSPAKLVAQANNVPDQVNPYTDMVKKIFSLGKEVWVFAKDNKAVVEDKANNTNTYVLAGDDKSGAAYGYAKSSTSKKLTFKGTRLGWTNYQADMMLEVKYDARSPTYPGQFLPDVRVFVPSIQADWGYTLTGSAQVSNVHNVSGLGEVTGVDAPVPEISIVVTIEASNLSVNRQSVEFIANGATGARIKEGSNFDNSL